ncbi:hypothetical protein [Sphingomonas aerolata]|uniref:hypothetical protein n=1 Tax=Sphingomonas aerolata TaxID=185951 RepID=UPI002FDF6053
MRDAPGQLADRLHLLRLDQPRLGPLALGDLRGQPVVRRREFARPRLDLRLQRVGQIAQFGARLFAVLEMPRRQPLALPRAQRRPRRTDQRRRMQRAFEQRDIGDRLDLARAAPRFAALAQ